MLCVVPLLRALREQYPKSHLALMASPVNYAVMLNLRYIDELLKFDKTEFIGKEGGSLLRFPGYVKGLRALRCNVAVVPSTVSTSFTSDLLAWLSGARIRVGAGSIEGKENPSGFFFTHPRALDWRDRPTVHQVRRNLEIWPDPLPVPDCSLEITLSGHKVAEGKLFIDNIKRPGGRIVAYHPGAGKVPNRWPAPLFARLANELAGTDNAVTVITSGPMDREPVTAMVADLNGDYHVVDNQPIRQVAAILRYVDLVVTNDTGIMHVAAGVGTPVLSLFGPTSAEQWAPIGGNHRYLQGEGGDIARIRYEDVLRNAREMLEGRMLNDSHSP
jgi:heptosyltransferase-2